jgi:DNA-binding transcriptional LysR family regulator
MLTPFDLELFVAIAQTGSLTTAARVCGVTRATIARRLEVLEERLGVPLINKTTRELSLTEAGAVYLEGCRDTLVRLRQAEAAVHELGGAPRGALRIACPIIRIEQIVGPLTTAFAREYPDVDVQVHLSSEPINPLSSGFDIAVQIGFEVHAALIARCLLREKYTLMASPEYLSRRGTPTSISELAQHDLVVAVRANGVHEPWPLTAGGTFVVPRPKLLANAAGLLRVGALQGLGIGLLAHSLTRDDVASGALVPLLEGQVGQELPVSLVYAAGSRTSPKIRAFVDYAAQWVERLAVPSGLLGVDALQQGDAPVGTAESAPRLRSVAG